MAPRSGFLMTSTAAAAWPPPRPRVVTWWPACCRIRVRPPLACRRPTPRIQGCAGGPCSESQRLRLAGAEDEYCERCAPPPRLAVGRRRDAVVDAQVVSAIIGGVAAVVAALIAV